MSPAYSDLEFFEFGRLQAGDVLHVQGIGSFVAEGLEIDAVKFNHFSHNQLLASGPDVVSTLAHLGRAPWGNPKSEVRSSKFEIRSSPVRPPLAWALPLLLEGLGENAGLFSYMLWVLVLLHSFFLAYAHISMAADGLSERDRLNYSSDASRSYLLKRRPPDEI